MSVALDAKAEIFISDRELLGQLLRHVIENAVKFSPVDQPVEIRRHREDGRLEVRVADRGPGIDDTLLRSPLPFTQGDSSMTRTAQGLGLGLFAASRLAAVLDGTISFGSRPEAVPKPSSRSPLPTHPTCRPSTPRAPRRPERSRP